MAPQQLGCLPIGNHYILETTLGMARRFGQALIYESERTRARIATRKVVWERATKVIENPKYRAIAGAGHKKRSHCGQLGTDQRRVNSEPPKTILHEIRKASWEIPDLSSRLEDRKQRQGTHEQQQRTPIDHDAIHVPIAQGRVRVSRRLALRRGQPLQNFARRS